MINTKVTELSVRKHSFKTSYCLSSFHPALSAMQMDRTNTRERRSTAQTSCINVTNETRNSNRGRAIRRRYPAWSRASTPQAAGNWTQDHVVYRPWFIYPELRRCLVLFSLSSARPPLPRHTTVSLDAHTL